MRILCVVEFHDPSAHFFCLFCSQSLDSVRHFLRWQPYRGTASLSLTVCEYGPYSFFPWISKHCWFTTKFLPMVEKQNGRRLQSPFNICGNHTLSCVIFCFCYWIENCIRSGFSQLNMIQTLFLCFCIILEVYYLYWYWISLTTFLPVYYQYKAIILNSILMRYLNFPSILLKWWSSIPQSDSS